MRIKADYAILCLATITVLGAVVYATSIEDVVTKRYAESLARKG